MSVNIYQPMQFGKETFLPIEADDTRFVIDWHLEKDGGVPRTYISKWMNILP